MVTVTAYLPDTERCWVHHCWLHHFSGWENAPSHSCGLIVANVRPHFSSCIYSHVGDRLPGLQSRLQLCKVVWGAEEFHIRFLVHIPAANRRGLKAAKTICMYTDRQSFSEQGWECHLAPSLWREFCHRGQESLQECQISLWSSKFLSGKIWKWGSLSMSICLWSLYTALKYLSTYDLFHVIVIHSLIWIVLLLGTRYLVTWAVSLIMRRQVIMALWFRQICNYEGFQPSMNGCLKQSIGLMVSLPARICYGRSLYDRQLFQTNKDVLFGGIAELALTSRRYPMLPSTGGKGERERRWG